MPIFGGGGTKTVDSGAAEAARIQAETAEQNALREQKRWEAEQAQIAQDKADAAAQTAKEKADAEAEAARLAEEKRVQLANQGAAKAKTGDTSTDSSQLQQMKELMAYQKTMQQKKAIQDKENLLYPSGNSLVSMSGFNYSNPGGQRFYRS